MGRKFLTSAAIAAATFGVAASSAVAAAPSRTTLSNGTQLSSSAARSINQSMHQAVKNTTTPGSAFLVEHGHQAECTVPESAKNGGFENFFTKDTTVYLEFTGSVLVGDCSADLNDPQHIATSQDKPGPLGQVTIPANYKTYSEECDIQYKGQNFLGDAESIVYPDGEFTETCIAPVTIT
jgi:uncharacterized protein (DUF2147 family)